MFSGSTDNSTHYNSSKIKALLNRTGRFKNYFGESNTYKDRTRSRSVSVSKTREEENSRFVNPEKITDVNKQGDVINNTRNQDVKKKNVFIPWSSYAAFMGFSNTNNIHHKSSSIETVESKKNPDGDKLQVKKLKKEKHKPTTKSSRKRSSMTSIDSTTDLNKNAQQRNHKKDRKAKRDKHIKVYEEKHYEKTSKTVRKEKSNKSPICSLASQNKTSRTSVALLPTKKEISKKRCKGERIGKGRIVYTEKENEPIKEPPSTPPLNANGRKHMSIFNLDKYLIPDKLADSSSEMLKSKNVNDEEILIQSSISDDKFAKQKLSAHKNEESWSKTEDQPINGTKSKNSIFDECTPVVTVINCDSTSEAFYINKTITELMLKINVLKEVTPEDPISRRTQQKNIDGISCRKDVTIPFNNTKSLCDTERNQKTPENHDQLEEPIKILRDDKKSELKGERNISLKYESCDTAIKDQPKNRCLKKKKHKRKTFTKLSKKHIPMHSTSCESGFKCPNDGSESFQIDKSKLISFDKCRSTSSNNFIIRHIVKSQQFDQIRGDDDSMIPKKKISEDSLKQSDASLIRSETIYDTEMTEDSLINEYCKRTRKVCNKRRGLNRIASITTDSGNKIAHRNTSNSTPLFEKCEMFSASTTIDENSASKSKNSENCINKGEETMENGETTEKISEEENEVKHEEKEADASVSKLLHSCEYKKGLTNQIQESVFVQNQFLSVQEFEANKNTAWCTSFEKEFGLQTTDANVKTKTNGVTKKDVPNRFGENKGKEMNFINISVDCNNYACQKIINNFKFAKSSCDEGKDNKTRESRIPVLIPSTIHNNKKSMWREFCDIDLKKKKLCMVCSRELVIPKCVMKMQAVQTNVGPQQSDISTLVSLCSLENDSTTDKKTLKPKYHLISRAYCTVDDCINVGQNKFQTTPIKTESYTIESVKFNSKGLIATKAKNASSTSSSSTLQTNTSCIDRIQALMSSMNNKKCEKPKRGLWKNFKLSLRRKNNSRRDFEEPKKSMTKNITFLKRPKNDQKIMNKYMRQTT
ncbi:hypothetical protein FQR65_LT01786 [Abscondita terminalis]|nr:hypothetical protein FQR65_LT01786 [Abscondita terminalis]